MAYEKFSLYFTFIDKIVNKLIHTTMHVGLFDSTFYLLIFTVKLSMAPNSQNSNQNFFSISSKNEKELSVHIYVKKKNKAKKEINELGYG